MIIPITILLMIFSLAGLIFGLGRRSLGALYALSIVWWLGSFVSAYYTYLAWMERTYSENWAMIGFICLALPYAVLTSILILIELFFLRKWQEGQARLLRASLLALLIFLVLQMMVGFISG